jgi:hypothetical protein
MPRTNINVVQSTRAGVAITGTAADVANGNTIPNDGSVALLLKNTNASSTARVLTIHIAATIDGQAVTDRTVSVAAGAERIVGPFDPSTYGGRLKINGDNAELLITPIRIA